MRLLVFITDDGTPDGSGPLLYIPDRPDAVLPRNPRSFEWRYFATIDDTDNLAITEPNLEASIATTGYHIAKRLI